MFRLPHFPVEVTTVIFSVPGAGGIKGGMLFLQEMFRGLLSPVLREYLARVAGDSLGTSQI